MSMHMVVWHAEIAPLKLGKGTDRLLKQLQAAVQSLPTSPGSRAGLDSRLAVQVSAGGFVSGRSAY